MQFLVLGPTEVVDTRLGPVALGGMQRRALLAALVLRANQPCSVDWLTTAVWGDDAPPAAPSLLHPLVSRLRRVLEPGRAPGAEARVLTSVSGGYLLRASAEDIDAGRFEQLTAEAERVADDRPDECVALVEEALALWRGPAYADVADRPVAVAESVRLEERRLAAIELRVEALMRLGRLRETVGHLEALVAEHPLRERLWALLMTALYRSGRQADALRAYGDVRSTLIDELGIEPGRELRELEIAILRQDASLDPTPPAPVAAAIPRVRAPVLLTSERSTFVGRSDELDLLHSAWKRASVEGRQILFINGEAGVGKTRLVGEVARTVAAEDGHVIAGRCDDGMSVPYQPFVEALRHFADNVPDGALRASLGRYPGELVRLLPELAERFPDLPAPLRSDAETERYRLFDAVSAWLASASADRPILLVLDDLHWASTSTLLLLRHVARSPDPMRVLVLATHRPADPSHPLTATVAAVMRVDGCERVDLGGLDEADVRTLLEGSGFELSGADLDSVARALRVETGGNALFVGELLRHLVDVGVRRGADHGRGSLLGFGLPQGVRDVVGVRLGALSPEANLLLERASVVGVEVEHRLIADVAALRDDELDEAIGEAVLAGLLEVVPDKVVRYRFTHAVVRSAVYDAIPPARRARLHRVVAEAIEGLESAGPRDLDSLAEHWTRASVGDDPVKAVDYALRAGRRAQAMLAYETAAARYEQALDALGDVDDPRRAELLLALGESQAAAGEVVAAKASFDEAASVAQARGEVEQLARAALGYGVAGVTASTVDEHLVDLLERAAGALPAIDSSLRVKVLARLAAELYFSREVERRRALGDEAVAMARRVGDPEALAFALSAQHYILWGPDGLERRLEVARELSAVAALTGDTELILQGHRWNIIDLLEQGAIEQAERHIEQYAAIAAELRQPLYQWWSAVFETMRHLLAGRLDEATEKSQEAWRIGRRATDAAMQFFSIQSGFVLREKGHLDTLESAARALISRFPDVPAWRCALAVFFTDVGRHADARAELERIAARGFADLPRDLGWLPAMANMADVCAEVEDHDRGRLVYDLLLPYRGRHVVVGAAVACQGSVARPLGRLAALLGRWDEAEALFEEALAATRRMGAPGLLAHVEHDFARALGARGEPGDTERSSALLASAEATARRLGMTALQARIEGRDGARQA